MSASESQVMAALTDLGPEARYASLHRSMEAGRMDERAWTEMVKLCLEMGKGEEAVRHSQHIESVGVRAKVNQMLVEHGLIEPEEHRPDIAQSCVTDQDMQPTMGESLTDAFQFLVAGSIPIFAIGGTIAFGMLLLFGGMLSSMIGFVGATVVTIPLALVIHGAVWTMARRLLLASRSGFDDPPEMPNLRQMSGEIFEAAKDLLVTATILLAPGILIHWLVDMTIVQLLVLLGCWALLPSVFLIRQLMPGWRETRPGLVLKVMTRNRPLFRATAANLALFAPAALVMHAILDESVFLVVVYTGLLSVMPAFVAARLLGETLYYQAEDLTDLLGSPPKLR